MGYDGFLLDTLDTVDELIHRDLLAYEGAAGAMVRLVAELRRAYPDAVLIVNGGFSILKGTAPYVDGVVFEGVLATYDPQTKKYRDRTAEEKEFIGARLQGARGLGLPVFALEYVDPKNHARIRKLEAALREKGFLPFFSVRELDFYPGRNNKK